ncbi:MULTISPECIES: hypothetical protein [unclassified Phyllobacterium]|uniref:hypothetical protein n=1 Tax=unclassified Phyllobacterium TaxID=2638441 RepID=UPI003012FDFE
MKTGNGYMTRALKSNDPRFARVLSKLGYNRSDMVAEQVAPAKSEDLTELRAEYQRVVGKRPFNGWDAKELRAKITAAKGE